MTILIESGAKARMDFIIEHVPVEVSGLGSVEVLDHSTLLIDRIELLPQAVTAQSTKLNEKGLIHFLSTCNYPERYKVWWHSHGLMTPFWSSIDDETIGKLGSDWLVSIVGNTHLVYLARLDIFQPLRLRVDATLRVVSTLMPSEELDLQREIKEKVRGLHTSTRSSPPRRSG